MIANSKLLIWLSLILMIVLTLSACTGAEENLTGDDDLSNLNTPILGGNKEASTPTLNPGISTTATSTSEKPEASSAVEEMATSQAVIEDTEVPNPAEQEVIPTVRSEMNATSPGDVKLASGELQLIEFFAYW